MVKPKEETKSKAKPSTAKNSGSFFNMSSTKLLWLEITTALASLFTIFIWMSLFNFNAESRFDSFYTGYAGYEISKIIASLFGYSGFFLPPIISLFYLSFFVRKAIKYTAINSLLFLFLLPFFELLAFDPLNWEINGGWFGKKLLNNVFFYFGHTASWLIFIVVFAIYIIFTFKFSFSRALFRPGKAAIKMTGGFIEQVKNTKFFENDEIREKKDEPEESFLKPLEITPEKPKKEKKSKTRGNKENQEEENSIQTTILFNENNDQPPEEETKEEEFPDDGTEKEMEIQTFTKEINNDRVVLRTMENYKLPTFDLLIQDAPLEKKELHGEKIKETAVIIEKKLKQHKVIVSVVDAMVGPVVTMYAVALGEGVRVNQVSAMEQDLGISVGGKRIRVVSRIPDKPYIGIEVPNEIKETIRLRDILSSNEFDKHKDKGLPIALGQDVRGKPIAANLAKMPHLLVAGTTGSGKSVGVNTVIMSFLYTMTPDEVRFIMIDPKANEFNIYEGIPHLLLPVVTDPKKAALALKWAVDEMENRYRLLAENMVRDIDSYNQKIETMNKQLAEGISQIRKMPYIVVIIDEFADLMTVAAKDVEIAVMRIAQKARAAGIHLIIATQRPTRDVITGTIKSNLPVRIAFRVASKLDSRCILDTNGAELLLGNGDMLYVPPGSSEPMRVHGAYVSTDEIKSVIKFIRAQFPEGVTTDDSIILSSNPEQFIESDNDSGDSEGGSDEEKDAIWDDVIRYIRRSGTCSASMLQTKFKIGYNRARRIVERLEEDGIVGPPDGAAGKPRKVLIQPED